MFLCSFFFATFGCFVSATFGCFCSRTRLFLCYLWMFPDWDERSHCQPHRSLSVQEILLWIYMWHILCVCNVITLILMLIINSTNESKNFVQSKGKIIEYKPVDVKVLDVFPMWWTSPPSALYVTYLWNIFAIIHSSFSRRHWYHFRAAWEGGWRWRWCSPPAASPPASPSPPPTPPGRLCSPRQGWWWKVEEIGALLARGWSWGHLTFDIWHLTLDIWHIDMDIYMDINIIVIVIVMRSRDRNIVIGQTRIPISWVEEGGSSMRSGQTRWTHFFIPSDHGFITIFIKSDSSQFLWRCGKTHWAHREISVVNFWGKNRNIVFSCPSWGAGDKRK